jgi:predicted nuclease of predicted toxin-antitoxin system
VRFKVDENLPLEIAHRLRERAHDAATVPEQKLGGSSDHAVIAVCDAEGRALITADTDFADIRRYRPSDYPGIVGLRLPNMDRESASRAIERMIPLLAVEPLIGKLWIVEQSRVRIRGGDAVR